MLALSDELIAAYHLTGPFLDVGAGSGDVSKHYAKQGWSGVAIDPSPIAIAEATVALRSTGPHVEVIQGDVRNLLGHFRTVFLFDVLEHIPDDTRLLKDIAERTVPGGALLLAVPTNPNEWRWDDDFYGHVRRYTPSELTQRLNDAGFEIITSWDLTFPFFWLARRIATRFQQPREVPYASAEARTLASTQHNSWNTFPLFDRLLQSRILWFLPLILQKKFRRFSYGCERLVLAKKRLTPEDGRQP